MAMAMETTSSRASGERASRKGHADRSFAKDHDQTGRMMHVRNVTDSLAWSQPAWDALQQAGKYDQTLKVDRGFWPRMMRRFVPPSCYTREAHFSHMVAGEPIVVEGFPSPARGPIRHLAAEEAGEAIIDWMLSCKEPGKHRVYSGPAGSRRQYTLPEIARKWRADRTRLGVTDLHIRETRLEEIIDPADLSAFNLLCRSSDRARAQEMFSFVISSQGYLTDSHSDAPDSSNYCFIGKKLWLAWDTYEGMKHGLEDVERMPLTTKPRFDLHSWLALRSARWLLVNPGQTLFLPANLTHKVITLERYVGVGGFYLALPNCLRLLAYWIDRVPLWSKRDATGRNDELIGDIAKTVRDTILQLRDAPQEERRKLGWDYLEEAARLLLATCSSAQFRLLWSDPRFRCVAEVIPASWPLPRSESLRFAL
jgi:hypothetical protein